MVLRRGKYGVISQQMSTTVMSTGRPFTKLIKDSALSFARKRVLLGLWRPFRAVLIRFWGHTRPSPVIIAGYSSERTRLMISRVITHIFTIWSLCTHIYFTVKAEFLIGAIHAKNYQYNLHCSMEFVFIFLTTLSISYNCTVLAVYFRGLLIFKIYFFFIILVRNVCLPYAR